MTIETKFDKGDEVWGIRTTEIADRRKWITGSRTKHYGGTVKAISCRVGVTTNCAYEVKTRGTHIGPTLGYREEDLFPTADEAQAECDRRNKETAND